MADYVSLLIIALILMFFVAPPVLSTTAFENYPGTYPQEIYIKAVGDDGSPLPNAKVYLYMMTENGWKLVGTRYSNSAGVASFTPGLPVYYFTIFNPPSSVEYIYRSVNLMAVVEKGSYVGLYTFAVDPGKDSNTQKMVSVVAHSIPKNSTLTEQLIRNYPAPSPDATIVLNQWYQNTPVLRFSTNYNISAVCYYPMGSKIRIQTKWRDPSSPSGIWYDGGYVEITLEKGVESPWFNGGPQIIEVQFGFKYQDSYVTGSGSYIEVVNAVDTSNDPYLFKYLFYSWDGQPVSGVVDSIMDQNSTLYIPVSGGSTYIFSVQISLNANIIPPSFGASISLGVTKVPDPKGTLTIKTGFWYPGAMAKIASLGDSSYLDTRAFWLSSS